MDEGSKAFRQFAQYTEEMFPVAIGSKDITPLVASRRQMIPASRYFDPQWARAMVKVLSS